MKHYFLWSFMPMEIGDESINYLRIISVKANNRAEAEEKAFAMRDLLGIDFKNLQLHKIEEV